MKKRSIRTAILLPVLAVLIAGIAAMVVCIGALSSSTANDLTNRLISARVAEYVNDFESLNIEPYSALSTILPVIETVYEGAGDQSQAGDARAQAVSILGNALLGCENVTSMWTCWEPNAFDNADARYAGADYHDASGRFIPIVAKSGGDYTVTALNGYDKSDYYTKVRETGKPYITDPYVYAMAAGTQEMTLYTISMPIMKNGTVMGVVGADIDVAQVRSLMDNGSILDDGYLFVIASSGLIVTHKNEDALMTHYSTTWMGDYAEETEKVLAQGGNVEMLGYSDISGQAVRLLATAVMVGDTGRYWLICGAVPEDTVTASSTFIVVTSVGIGLALVLVVGVVVFFIVRRNLRALPQLTATAEAMAVGDIQAASFTVSSEPTRNEITLLTRAFAAMADGIRGQADMMKQIADGDYSMHVTERSQADTMSQAMEHMLETTNRSMAEIRTTSSQVSAGAQQIAQAAQNLAAGSTEQAATIEQFTAAVQEVREKSESIARTANQTLAEVENAGQLMGECDVAMDKMTAAMEEINESSQNISKVIKVIDDIAFQTNILALNAAVEAARAGQHGKGFAVVAEEVRSLASKSAEAAKETAELIEHSLESVREGTGMVKQVNESIQAVGVIAAKNAVSMGQMDEASRQQNDSMEYITTGINQLSTVVQANSATSEQTAASAQEMSAQAVVLDGIVSRFKLAESAGTELPPAPARHAPEPEGSSLFGADSKY